MDNVITFKTPGGEEMVVLSRAEYDRMIEVLEDHEDAAAFDEVMRKLETGEEEFIPSAMVDRLLNGENKVRVWREHRGLTATQLADCADVSAAYVSQIEKGAREGSIETFKKLAAALRVTIDDLV